IFMICNVISGHFLPNLETSDSGYFSLNELPELSTEKNTYEQIQMCFTAYHDNSWVVKFD
ncbi:MAG: ADP-ribose pyrophosphatase, partial [Candidatus Cloacimonetes bacterium]|nr:ADP-ribose pyrophosphatase [Candidatus Cloacimonadota bacterium]